MDNLLDEQTIDWMNKWTQSFNSNLLPWNEEWTSEEKTIYSSFEGFWYNNADKTEKVGDTRIQHKEGKREKKLEVKSIMDGSEKKKGTPSTTLLSLSLPLNILKKEWWERQKMTYSKATTTNRMYVCITDDKCVSYWCKLKYRKNSEKALVYNYSDESLVQYRSRCPKAFHIR